MNPHILRLCVLAIGLSVGAAQSGAARTVEFHLTLSAEDRTALTLAPDGSFGAAMHTFINGAIAGAIARCRTMSRQQLGCGALLATVQAGWSLGVRRGAENIIAPQRSLPTRNASPRGARPRCANSMLPICQPAGAS